MATRTGIQNISGQFLMLPPPYAGGLPAGAMAIVSDSQAVVQAALGGATFIKNGLLITALPGTATTTAHNNALGQDKFLETSGNNGAGAVTFAAAKVGDAVKNVSATVTGADQTASFEATVSVAGQVQQTSASDLSSTKLLFVLLGKS